MERFRAYNDILLSFRYFKIRGIHWFSLFIVIITILVIFRINHNNIELNANYVSLKLITDQTSSSISSSTISPFIWSKESSIEVSTFNFTIFPAYHQLWTLFHQELNKVGRICDTEQIGYAGDFVCYYKLHQRNKCSYLSTRSINPKRSGDSLNYDTSYHHFHKFITSRYSCELAETTILTPSSYDTNILHLRKTTTTTSKVEKVYPIDSEDIPSLVRIWLKSQTKAKKLDILRLSNCRGCEYSFASVVTTQFPLLFQHVDQFIMTINFPKQLISQRELYELNQLFLLLKASSHRLVRINKVPCQQNDSSLINDHYRGDDDEDNSCPKYFQRAGLHCFSRCIKLLFIHKPDDSSSSFLSNLVKSSSLLIPWTKSFLGPSLSRTLNLVSSPPPILHEIEIPGKTIWLLWLQGWYDHLVHVHDGCLCVEL